MRTQLQKSLIRSHSAGMGPAVEREVVRALMFLRAKTLASGRTGVRPVVLQTMVDVLNAGITPVVYEFGSLGCSGDLAPLSHCALVLMGEGEAAGPDGVVRPVPELLADAGIRPVELAEKEGLAPSWPRTGSAIPACRTPIRCDAHRRSQAPRGIPWNTP